MIEGGLQVLNWNIAGAKYLELPTVGERNEFRAKLNGTLKMLLGTNPLVVTLQELVKYDADGRVDDAQTVIDVPEGYQFSPVWLIDSHNQSARGKWNKVRKLGGWSPDAYFAQGNGFLIRDDLARFRVFDLPVAGHQAARATPIEKVMLESGLYLGDRNTEPRAAVIAHLVLDSVRGDGGVVRLSNPLDLFVINLHLTTLIAEREGIPQIDEEAAKKRLAQLDIVINGIISPYNSWRKDDYRIRGEHVSPSSRESHERYSPIWVIAGDFNFTPESVEYQTVIRAGFIDLIQHHDLGTKASGLGRRPTLTVDYVFAGPRYASIDPGFAKEHIKVNSVRFDRQTEISDHFPLIVSVPVTLPDNLREHCKLCGELASMETHAVA